MAESYIQMFQEKFYPSIFLDTADKTILYFEEHEEQIVESAKKKLCEYLKEITQLQKKQKIGAIEEITLSFLYTSIEENHAKMRIDSYESGGRIWNESLLTDDMPVDWLMIALDEMMIQFQECVKKESLRRYIRPAEFEVLKLRAIRSLLYFFASRFRYIIQDMLDLKALAKVNKMDSFVIQMGEYMDWQVPIFAMLPEVDIFNCDKEVGLKFRHFPAVHYEKKEFVDLEMEMSKFDDCTFEQVIINGCNMNDCIFDGCNFEEVIIQDTKMVAASFVSCTFKKVTFKNVVFGGRIIEGHETEYFELPGFYECSFQESAFCNCKLPECIVEDCEIINLAIDSCDAEESDFLALDQIEWRQGSQEEEDGIL